MLSIVIPIYNRDVKTLVKNLSKQCEKAKIAYQIICFDDGSKEQFKEKNRSLAFKINVNYTEMEENLGRSRIRNWLGRAAFFDYILFLDCDSVVNSKDFIKNYLAYLPTDSVICGGRIYRNKPPRSKRKILHWKYGLSRESLNAKKRNKHPAMNFHSNNFIIPEVVFSAHNFDESVVGYGYEDLLYAYNLERNGVNIVHIDNPVIHDGLEFNKDFMKKTENAITNLADLYLSNKMSKTRLINKYEQLKSWNLLNLFCKIYDKYSEKIQENLLSENPSIMKFNLWKLRLFISKVEKYK